MGARLTRCSGNATGAHRGAYSRVCGASTAFRPVAVGVGGAERGAPMSQSAYRRVCGAATPKPPVAIERVTPHGCPDAARGVQPGLRGLDGETPSCAGLCGGRTRSKSNGCSGDSMTGPAIRLRNRRPSMYDADMSEPHDTPKYRNRLLQETSPYLLQHAHNPVDWYPWGEEALARAKAENKP